MMNKQNGTAYNTVACKKWKETGGELVCQTSCPFILRFPCCTVNNSRYGTSGLVLIGSVDTTFCFVPSCGVNSMLLLFKWFVC